MKGLRWLRLAGTVAAQMTPAGAVFNAVNTAVGAQEGREARGHEKRALALDAAVGMLLPLAERGMHFDADDARVRDVLGRAIDVAVEIENLAAEAKAQRDAAARDGGGPAA
jgi:hypothetical protein